MNSMTVAMIFRWLNYALNDQTDEGEGVSAEQDNWPDCIVPGCPNKCCLALDSIRCYPHTLGLPPDFATKWIAEKFEPETND